MNFMSHRAHACAIISRMPILTGYVEDNLCNRNVEMFMNSFTDSCSSMLVEILITRNGLNLVAYAALKVSCILFSLNDRYHSIILKNSQLQL